MNKLQKIAEFSKKASRILSTTSSKIKSEVLKYAAIQIKKNIAEIEKANKDGRVCVKPTTFLLMITMLCPPLGLFVHLGVRGWFHIIVCVFLTIKTYYFPGFIYAIMHMIC